MNQISRALKHHVRASQLSITLENPLLGYFAVLSLSFKENLFFYGEKKNSYKQIRKISSDVTINSNSESVGM